MSLFYCCWCSSTISVMTEIHSQPFFLLKRRIKSKITVVLEIPVIPLEEGFPIHEARFSPATIVTSSGKSQLVIIMIMHRIAK